MRTSGTAGEHRPSTMTSTVVTIPPIACNHGDDVAEVTVLNGFRLHVRFHDGTEGEVDMSVLVQSARAGVFAQLADPSLFAQVHVEHGAVTWPGELDLAPDAMYTEISQHGKWTL